MTPNDPLIVVVDDDIDVLKALKRLLRSLTYAVRTFSSAAEFLHCCSEFEPACVILDVQMPVMNGLEAHRRMRAANCHAPVVFVTAHDDPKVRLYAEQAGAFFLLKPVSEQLLQAALHSALTPGASERELPACATLMPDSCKAGFP